jgi:GNAT superfamily N-acetyltransferase
MTQRWPAITVAPARPSDVSVLLELISGLAEYERLTHLMENTEQRLSEALFGKTPVAQALIGWVEEDAIPLAVGFALFFHNYSTFLGRRGLYLEDIFVRPSFRGRGYGKTLLIEVARIAVERQCGRFEWSVLDWNTPAQSFYKRLGATVMPDWRIVRVTGEALTALAEQTSHND